MIFEKVIIKNFHSFNENEQEVNLKTNTLTLITGFNEISGSSNGSGKSSLIDAIIWGLYGKSRNNADDVCNKYSGNKNTKVQVDFTKDKDYYEIIRYRKHQEQGNRLYIFKNKKDLSYDSAKDTQIEIEKILGISYHAFISSLVFEKENYTPFLHSTATKRLEIIENIILNADEINGYFEKTKKFIKTGTEKINEIDQEIKEKEWTIKSCLKNIEQYKEGIQKKIKTSTSLITSLEEQKKSLSSYKNLDEIKKNIIRKSETEDKIDSIKEKITIHSSQINESVENTLFKIKECGEKIIKVSDEIAEIQENIDTCPVCGNHISKDKMEIELSKYEKKKKELEDKKKELENKLPEIRDKEELSRKTIGSLISEQKTLTEEFKSIPSYDITIEEIDNLNNIINDINYKINSNKEIINNSNLDNSFEQNKLEEIRKSEKEIKTLNKKLKLFKDHMKSLDFFYNLFSNKSGGIKKYLINKILDVLNNKVNEFLSIYFPYQIDITFDANLNETIKVEGDDFSFQEFSSGEKMRVELSCVFALFYIIKSFMCVSSNILILDEILDLNLDLNGIRATINILNNLKDEGNSIFVISHKSDYNDHFTERIKVIKEKNKKSRIEYEQ